jgi:hypothetical protein
MDNSTTNQTQGGRLKQCQHVKTDGTRCRANAISRSRFCFFHDPRKAKQRAAARKAGGYKKNKAAALPSDTPDRPLESLADVVSLLGETINQVRRGEIDPRVSNAVGYLTNVLIKALEQGSLEERLAALEATVNSQSHQQTSLFVPEPEELSFAYESKRAPV